MELCLIVAYFDTFMVYKFTSHGMVVFVHQDVILTETTKPLIFSKSFFLS